MIAPGDFERFNGTLAMLVRSGTPLSDAVREAARGVEAPDTGEALKRLGDEIEKGTGFDRAVEREQAAFPAGYLAIVRAGLESGNLGSVLDLVVRSARRINAIRREVGSLLVYPACVLGVLSAYAFLVLFHVVPAFMGAVPSLGGTPGPAMPWWSSGAIHLYLFVIGAGAAVLSALGLVASVRFLSGRAGGPLPVSQLEWIPMLGVYARSWTAAAFLHEFTALLKSGVSFVPALRLCAASFDHGTVRIQLTAAADAVDRGEVPRRAVGRIRFLPGPVRILFDSPATDRQLFDCLEAAAAGCERDLGRHAESFRRRFETLALFAVGAAVAGTYLLFWGLYLFAVGAPLR
ncbi:MAG: type II secretion system F family protein [Candidatus Coatesbacteria bacterium]